MWMCWLIHEETCSCLLGYKISYSIQLEGMWQAEMLLEDMWQAEMLLALIDGLCSLELRLNAVLFYLVL
jgi:hypothetical protein